MLMSLLYRIAGLRNGSLIVMHAEVVMTEGVFFWYSREPKPVIKLMIEDVAAHTMSQEHTHPHTLCRQGVLRAQARPGPRRHVAVATAALLCAGK